MNAVCMYKIIYIILIFVISIQIQCYILIFNFSKQSSHMSCDKLRENRHPLL